MFSNFSIGVLLLDPGIGFGQAIAEGNVGFPIEDLLDECVVAVSPGNAARRSEIILAFQFDLRRSPPPY